MIDESNRRHYIYLKKRERRHEEDIKSNNSRHLDDIRRHEARLSRLLANYNEADRKNREILQ